jgi:hypothetical protein
VPACKRPCLCRTPPPPFPRYQYHNIFSLLRELGGEWPLSDWTTSGFWSPRGLVTQAPVFSQLPRLPTMLGQFVHTFPLPWDIPLQVGALGCRGLGAEGHGASASAQLALAGAPAPPHGPPPAPPPHPPQERLTMLPFLLSFLDYDSDPETFLRCAAARR